MNAPLTNTTDFQPIEFLAPRAEVLARRANIIADLAELLPREGLVSEARSLVPFETDGLPPIATCLWLSPA